jgi:hypothetical protein
VGSLRDRAGAREDGELRDRRQSRQVVRDFVIRIHEEEGRR